LATTKDTQNKFMVAIKMWHNFATKFKTFTAT